MNLEIIINPAIAIISYCLGVLSGIFIQRYLDKNKTAQEEKNNSSLVLITVTIIWAISMIVDIMSPAYETSPLVHGLMGAIVGFYYKAKKQI